MKTIFLHSLLPLSSPARSLLATRMVVSEWHRSVLDWTTLVALHRDQGQCNGSTVVHA